jgi:hypothetical protein
LCPAQVGQESAPRGIGIANLLDAPIEWFLQQHAILALAS